MMTDLHNIAALIWIIFAIISIILICFTWVAITRLQRRHDAVHSFVASALGGRFLFCLVPLLLVASVTIEHRSWSLIESQLAFWAFTSSWLTDALTTALALATGFIQLSRRCAAMRKIFTDSSIAATWVASTILAGVVVLIHDTEAHQLGPLYCWLLPNAHEYSLGILFIFLYFLFCIYIVVLASILALRTAILAKRRDTNEEDAAPTANGHVTHSNGGVLPVTVALHAGKTFSNTQRINVLNTLSIMTVFLNLIPQCIILGISLIRETEVDTGPIVLVTCALIHALGLPLCICTASRDYRSAMISVLRRKSLDQEASSRGSQQATIDAIQSDIGRTDAINGMGVYSQHSPPMSRNSPDSDVTYRSDGLDNHAFDLDSPGETASSSGCDTDQRHVTFAPVSRSVSSVQQPRAPPRVKRSQSNQTRKEWLHTMRNSFLPSIVIQEASDSSPERHTIRQTNKNIPVNKRTSTISEVSTESEDNVGYNDADIDQALEEIIEETNESTETTDSQPSPNQPRRMSEINVHEIEEDARSDVSGSVYADGQTSSPEGVGDGDEKHARTGSSVTQDDTTVSVTDAAGDEKSGQNTPPKESGSPRFNQPKYKAPSLPTKDKKQEENGIDYLKPGGTDGVSDVRPSGRTSDNPSVPPEKVTDGGAAEQKSTRRSNSARSTSRLSQRSNTDRLPASSRRSSTRKESGSRRESGRKAGDSGGMNDASKQALLKKAMARRRRISSSSSDSTMPESSNEGSFQLTDISVKRQASMASRGSRGRSDLLRDPFDTDWTQKYLHSQTFDEDDGAEHLSRTGSLQRGVNRSSSHLRRDGFQYHSVRESGRARKSPYNERSSMRNVNKWRRHLSRHRSRDDVHQSHESLRSSRRNYVHYPVHDAVLHRDRSYKVVNRDVGYHIHEEYTPPRSRDRLHTRSRTNYDGVPSKHYVYDGMRRGSSSAHRRYSEYDTSPENPGLYSRARRESTESNMSELLYHRDSAIAHQMAERHALDAISRQNSVQAYPEMTSSINPFTRDYRPTRRTSSKMRQYYNGDADYAYEKEMKLLRQQRLNTYGASPYESVNNPFLYEKQDTVSGNSQANSYPEINVHKPFPRQRTLHDAESAESFAELTDISENNSTNPFILSVPTDEQEISTLTNPFIEYVSPQVHVASKKTNPFLYPPSEERPLHSDGDIVHSKNTHQESVNNGKSKTARSRWRKVAMGLSIVDFLRSKSAKLSVMDNGEKVGNKRRLNPFYTAPSMPETPAETVDGAYRTKYETEYI